MQTRRQKRLLVANSTGATDPGRVNKKVKVEKADTVSTSSVNLAKMDKEITKKMDEDINLLDQTAAKGENDIPRPVKKEEPHEDRNDSSTIVKIEQKNSLQEKMSQPKKEEIPEAKVKQSGQDTEHTNGSPKLVKKEGNHKDRSNSPKMGGKESAEETKSSPTKTEEKEETSKCAMENENPGKDTEEELSKLKAPQLKKKTFECSCRWGL